MELAAANTRYDELHKARPYHDGSFKDWVAEPSLSHPYHFRAGVLIAIEPTDLTPDDHFLTNERGEKKEVSDGGGEVGEGGP